MSKTKKCNQCPFDGEFGHQPHCLEYHLAKADGPPTTELAESEGNLEMDAGAGESDYSHSLTFTSSKFIVTAFGHDREHCEDVLQCVLAGRFKDHAGDREFVPPTAPPAESVEDAKASMLSRAYALTQLGLMIERFEIISFGDALKMDSHSHRKH